MTLRFGVERPDVWHRWIRGQRVALVSHPAAVDRTGRLTVQMLMEERDWQLVGLWSAEHGFWSTHQDHEMVEDTVNPWIRRPIFSLYQSGRLAPPPSWLAHVDVIVFDMQDVGTRYYTYIHTLADILAAVHNTPVRVVVLDRPNPLGGLQVEGPLLEPALYSFVGVHRMPVRHGLTVGEFARWFVNERGFNVRLRVVRMRGWSRAQYWPDLNRPWMNPSPNMPNWTTALVYPGMCLMEGTNVSEGRGTTRPFEWCGAPWIDPFELADALNRLRLPGVRFWPTVFRPTFHKYAGHDCGGIQLHVTDVRRFRPFWTGVAIVQTIARRYPQYFAWRTEPYEFVTDRLAFDLLCGTPAIRQAIESGHDAVALRRVHDRLARAWQRRVRVFWLYD